MSISSYLSFNRTTLTMTSNISGDNAKSFEEQKKKTMDNFISLRNEADKKIKENLEKSLPVGRALKIYVKADMEIKKMQMEGNQSLN